MERMARGGATMSGASAGGREEIAALDNNSLIIRLHFTVNHLSRWLSPIHDESRLRRSVYRGEASVRDLVLRLRDEELRIFPKMHAIAVRTQPDLDKLPPVRRAPEEERHDREAPVLELRAEFRRLRQSTCSLLRSLPDDAWDRVGISRREHDWTLRALAEHLALHDWATLADMDRALDQIGVRDGIATVSRVRFSELLRLDRASGA